MIALLLAISWVPSARTMMMREGRPPGIMATAIEMALSKAILKGSLIGDKEGHDSKDDNENCQPATKDLYL